MRSPVGKVVFLLVAFGLGANGGCTSDSEEGLVSACFAGDTRCDGHVLMRCTDGVWVDGEDCGAADRNCVQDNVTLDHECRESTLFGAHDVCREAGGESYLAEDACPVGTRLLEGVRCLDSDMVCCRGASPWYPNPAVAYCIDTGNLVDKRVDSAGSSYFVCLFDDGSECLAWDYHAGACGPDECASAEECVYETALRVWPESMTAVPHQRAMFLVEVERQSGSDLMGLSADASGGAVTISGPHLQQGEVGEVVVVPDELSVGSTVLVVISGRSATHDLSRTVSIHVVAAGDDVSAQAMAIHDCFLDFVVREHPDLGETLGSAVEGTVVRPDDPHWHHYLFLGAAWEVGLRWATRAASDPGALVYLRPRGRSTAPQRAFEIVTLSDPCSEPVEIEDLDDPMLGLTQVWR